MDRTIIYTTNNNLDEKLFSICQKELIKAAGDIPIISVSQKPIALGKNVCVGELPYNHLSMFKQLTIGVLLAETEYIVVCEHDCLYTPEHLNWTPLQKDTFYYNHNHWLLQWDGEHKGLYSHKRRRVLSQCIAGRDIMRQALMERVDIVERGFYVIPNGTACEPGCSDRQAFLRRENQDLGKDITKYKAERFETQNPNLDVRHDKNFSGSFIGKHGRCWELPYWGKFDEYLKRNYE